MKNVDNKKQFSVVCTSVGNDGFQAVWKALSDSIYRLVGIDCDRDCYGIELSNGYEVPERVSANYYNAVVDVCKKVKAKVIYPLSTDDQDYYAEHIGRFRTDDISVIVSDAGSLEIANDKLKLLEFAKEIGTNIPRYSIVESTDELHAAINNIGWKNGLIVAKKSRSTGCQGVKIIDNKSKTYEMFYNRERVHVSFEEFLHWLENRKDRDDGLHLIEYLPGKEYSVDVFLDGEVKCVVTRRRHRAYYGMATIAETISFPELEEQAGFLAKRIGLKNVVNIQFREDEKGIPRLMEINPRIPAGIDLTIAAGCNMPLWAIEKAHGIEPVYTRPIIGAKMRRRWDAVFSGVR